MLKNEIQFHSVSIQPFFNRKLRQQSEGYRNESEAVSQILVYSSAVRFRKSSTLFAVNSEKSSSESAEVIANQYIDAGSSTSKIDSETAFSLYAVNKRPWFIYKPSVFNKSGAKSFAIPPELAKPEGNNYISKPNGDGRIGMASSEEIPLDNVSLNESDWSVLNLESCDTDIGSDLENSVEDIENYIDKNMLA
uniref:Uncharacterized protein n=1 Tax=Ditylenchus dipsaci TaxID=166011 RepID=A0A915EDP8_9BILA